MLTARSAGWLLASVSAAGALLSAYFMAYRVAAFNEAAHPSRWHFDRTFSRSREFKGRTVELQDAKLENGAPALRLTFADQKRLIPVTPPLVPNLPDLAAYEESVALLAYAPIKDGDIQVNPETGEGSSLALVVRNTAGYDAASWGAVRVKDWWFDIYELRDDGTIRHRVMQFPDRRGNLPAKVEQPSASVEELQERSWEWQAALHAVPKSQISRYRFKTDAVKGDEGIEGMRWTLPAAGFSTMGLVVGVVLIAGDRVSRRRALSAAPRP